MKTIKYLNYIGKSILVLPTCFLMLFIFEIEKWENKDNNLIWTQQKAYLSEVLQFNELNYDDKILNQTYYSNYELESNNKRHLLLLALISAAVIIGSTLIYYKFYPTVDINDIVVSKEFTIIDHATLNRNAITQVLISVTSYLPSGEITSIDKFKIIMPSDCFFTFDCYFGKSMQALLDYPILLKLTIIDVLGYIDDPVKYQNFQDLWHNMINKVK